jgi:hypothetical protein
MKLFERFLALKPHGEDANWVKSYIAEWKAWEAEDRLQ